GLDNIFNKLPPVSGNALPLPRDLVDAFISQRVLHRAKELTFFYLRADVVQTSAGGQGYAQEFFSEGFKADSAGVLRCMGAQGAEAGILHVVPELDHLGILL